MELSTISITNHYYHYPKTDFLDDKIKILRRLTRMVGVISLSRFLLLLLLPRQIHNACTATAPVPVYQISAPGEIPGHLANLYRDTASVL